MKIAIIILILALASITLSKRIKNKKNSKKYYGGSYYSYSPISSYSYTTLPAIVDPNEEYTKYIAAGSKNFNDEIREVTYKYKGATLQEHSYKIGGVEMSKYKPPAEVPAAGGAKEEEKKPARFRKRRNLRKFKN